MGFSASSINRGYKVCKLTILLMHTHTYTSVVMVDRASIKLCMDCGSPVLLSVSAVVLFFTASSLSPTLKRM